MKNGSKIEDAVSTLIKYSDEITDGGEAVLKHVDDAADAAEAAGKNADSLEELYKQLDEEWYRGETAVEGAGKIMLPTNDSQLKHIFREADGHLPDTATNRVLVESTANDSKYFVGSDAYGTRWYAKIQPDGSQVWVRTYNGTVTNAGINTTPRTFDPKTGLNYNPFKQEVLKLWY